MSKFFSVALVGVALLVQSACNQKQSADQAVATDLDTSVVADNGMTQGDTTQAFVAGINELTDAEKKDGWKLLFDGTSTKGWRGAYRILL